MSNGIFVFGLSCLHHNKQIEGWVSKTYYIDTGSCLVGNNVSLSSPTNGILCCFVFLLRLQYQALLLVCVGEEWSASWWNRWHARWQALCLPSQATVLLATHIAALSDIFLKWGQRSFGLRWSRTLNVSLSPLMQCVPSAVSPARLSESDSDSQWHVIDLIMKQTTPPPHEQVKGLYCRHSRLTQL